MRPADLSPKGSGTGGQGASGVSSWLVGLSEGLPNLTPVPYRRAGPLRPYSWSAYGLRFASSRQTYSLRTQW